MPRGQDMADFWDARATEDAFYFVDNRLEYGNPDEARFWRQGQDDLATLLDIAGASLIPGLVVAEIGCGLGRLTRPLAAQVQHVHALDVSAEMLDKARQLNPGLPNVTWHHGDGVSLQPLSDASVDACVSHVVFQHIPDASITLGYIREMGRVLKPGGWSAFQVSTNQEVHSRSVFAKTRMALLSRLRRGPRGQSAPFWLGSAVSLDELTSTAAAVGLTIDQIHGEGTQYCVVRLGRPRTPA